MPDATIGALSRRTGLSVKTIRYYSEIGLVPESRRTHSGYRRYDSSALIRLELVRTLRELGLDLGACTDSPTHPLSSGAASCPTFSTTSLPALTSIPRSRQASAGPCPNCPRTRPTSRSTPGWSWPS